MVDEVIEDVGGKALAQPKVTRIASSAEGDNLFSLTLRGEEEGVDYAVEGGCADECAFLVVNQGLFENRR